MTGHTGTKLIHRTGPFEHRPETKSRLNQRFPHVSSTRQEVSNPASQSEYEEKCTDEGQNQARRQTSTKECKPQSQDDRPGRRARHFQTLRIGRVLPD